MQPSDIIGAIATVISFILYIPSGITVWKNRSNPRALQGVSIATNTMILINTVLWGAYAVLTNQIFVGLSGLVSGPLALATIVLVLRSRKMEIKPDIMVTTEIAIVTSAMDVITKSQPIVTRERAAV